jgi:hypothetical protein
VFLLRYELGFNIIEEEILHSHRREHLSYEFIRILNVPTKQATFPLSIVLPTGYEIKCGH